MLILSFILWLFSSNTSVKTVVVEYHGLKNKKEELAFIEKYKSYSSASYLGYVYSIQMKQAEYSYNPATKLKTFNKYNDKLNALVNSNPNNIHARYVRLFTQEQLPSFLSDDDIIKADKTFLKSKLGKDRSLAYLDQYIKQNTSL